MKKKAKKVTKKEFDDLRNQLARALADYDNLRKRVEKEKEHFKNIANLMLIARLLPIWDMLVDAQKHLQDQGLVIIIGEFEDVLKDEGVVKIEPKKGDKFDEGVHEAIEAVDEKEAKKGEIVETVLTGWRYEGGPVIRPAKVKVVRK
jgi:molecular chaperone GrpE